MICPYCKTELEDDASFCSNCGSPLPHQSTAHSLAQQTAHPSFAQQPAPQSFTQQPGSQPIVKKSPVAIVLACIFAVLTFSLLGTTLFFYSKYSAAQELAGHYEEELEKEKKARKIVDTEVQHDEESYPGENMEFHSQMGLYRENSRRATDIATAEKIRMSILADMAEQRYPFTEPGYFVAITGDYVPSSIQEAPTMEASGFYGEYFIASWDYSNAFVDVYDSRGLYLLSDSYGAQDFKNRVAPGQYTSTVK